MAEHNALVNASPPFSVDAIEAIQQSLPANIISLILEQVVTQDGIVECFQLRLVNRYFDREVLYLLFDRFYIDWIFDAGLWNERRNSYVLHLTVWRYWNAFIRSEDIFGRIMSWASNPYHPRYAGRASDRVNWLLSLHRMLREAVQNMLKTCRSGSHIDGDEVTSATEGSAVSFGDCVSMLCDGALCALGPLHAWKLLHLHPPIVTREFFSVKLSTVPIQIPLPAVVKPALFWEAIAATYRGNLEELRAVLDVDNKQQYSADWIRRVQDDYYGFTMVSTVDERQWLELLATCLKVAVTKDHVAITSFLLDQDPSTEAETFSSIYSTDLRLLTLAISHTAINVITLFTERGWLEKLSVKGKLASHHHFWAVTLMMEPPKPCPKRHVILKKLLSLNDCWQIISNIESMLHKAARNNDVSIVEIIVSSMQGEPQGSLRSGLRRNCNINQHPLMTAISLGHHEVARSMLLHYRKLYLPSMISDYFSGCDFRTQPITYLLRPQNANHSINLPELLRSARRHRIEQIRAIVNEPENSAMYTLFFTHVNVNDRISHTDAKSLGEHALCAAITCVQFSCAKHLIETLGVRFKSARVLPSREEMRKFAPAARITDLSERSEIFLNMKSLLLKYEMILHNNSTVVRVVGSQCRHDHPVLDGNEGRAGGYKSGRGVRNGLK